jgi:hypothetical protein
MRRLRVLFVLALNLVILVGFVAAQKKATPSDAQYIARACSAAPKEVSKDAAVVRLHANGKMTTVRAGKNAFSCMVIGSESMCADANSMAFFDTWAKRQPPPDKLGLTYMLRGDEGASNTDPYATGKTPDNHWVVTGPHIMIVGAASKTLGLPSSPDADPTGPYMMWAGTPYEHAMIPVGPSKGVPKAASEKGDPAKE